MVYIPPSISGYNSSPPSDDGAQTTANKVYWATIKTKLSDPIKNFVDSVNAAVSDAFSSVFLGTAVDRASSFALGTTDDGTLFNCTSALTATLPVNNVSLAGYHVLILHSAGTGLVTIGGNGSNINGSANLVLYNAGDWAIVVSDGVAWKAAEVGFTRINTFTEAVVSATDVFSFVDISDGNRTKKDTVQGLLDLAATPAQGAKADTALQPATQAELEAETANKGLDGANAKYHPGVAKAWINFNGTGTPAIRSSYNVLSITDNGSGNYTINFVNALADANYCVVANYVQSSGGSTATGWQAKVYAQTTAGFSISTGGDGTSGGSLGDAAIVTAVVFGDF